jgi:hypothetical protein
MRLIALREITLPGAAEKHKRSAQILSAHANRGPKSECRHADLAHGHELASAASRQRQVAMHRHQLREIIHDVNIVCAITPIVQRHHLTVDATTDLLTQ